MPDKDPADVYAKWIEVCDRLDAHGYAYLPDAERLWVCIRELIDAVENGGAISYFYNSMADNLLDCLEALNVLDAPDVKVQIERVCALFPEGTPGDFDARNGAIESWPDDDPSRDAVLEDVDDTLMPLMADLEDKLLAYLRRNGVSR